jgi:hypothetical protein
MTNMRVHFYSVICNYLLNTGRIPKTKGALCVALKLS